MQIETRYAQSGDANIAYQVIGQGPLDIVFIPCWLSHLDRMWREPIFVRFMERLSSVARVIIFDKRGIGLSDPVSSSATESLEERMDDLTAVLDAVGSASAVLFGTSIGGRLSALYAATYPERVRGLMLFATSARGTRAPDYPWGPTPDEHRQRAEHIIEAWGGPIWSDRYFPTLMRDQQFCSWWAECLRSAGGPTAAVAMLRLDAESDIRSILPSIQTPTLVLHRRDDAVVSFEEGRYLAESFPAARFVPLHGGDHLPYVGDQDALFREIDRFISRRLAVAPVRKALATVVAVSFGGIPEASRRLNAEQWSAARSSLLAAIRSVHRRYHGLVAMQMGDGFTAAFDGPSRAIHFAREMLDVARRHGLTAKVGLHTGAVEQSDEHLGGVATELASRIAMLAERNEILISGTLVGLVSGSTLRFVQLEDDDLSGIPPGLRVFRVLSGATTPAAAPQAIIDSTAAIELSPREREVAFQVARGLSNREVGLELDISVSTVERHVANILAKLGYRSRAQLSLWAAEQQPRLGAPELPQPAAELAGYAAG